MTHLTSPHKGFTLVETLIAITILAIAIVGPFSAIQTAINSSYVARDELVGTMLAQEAIEYVRSIRDDNYLGGRAWMDFPYSCAGASPTNFCTVDATQGDFHTTPAAVNAYSQVALVPALSLTTNGLYNQQGQGTATVFKRYVQITTVSATESDVKVIVSWTTAHQQYQVVITDKLYNWL